MVKGRFFKILTVSFPHLNEKVFIQIHLASFFVLSKKPQLLSNRVKNSSIFAHLFSTSVKQEICKYKLREELI